MDNEPVQHSDLEQLLVDDKAEWAESLDAIVAQYGAAGAREILRSLQNHVLGLNIPLDEATLNTPYRNTIAPDAQPVYPGNIELEEKIEKLLRWNAIAMVLRAQDKGLVWADILRPTLPAPPCWKWASTISFRVPDQTMTAARLTCCCRSPTQRRASTPGRF